MKYVTCVTFPITTFITTRSTPIKTFPCLTSPCVWDVVFFPQPLVLLRPFIVEIVGCGHFFRCLSHFLVSHLGFIYWLCISLRGDIPRQSQSFLYLLIALMKSYIVINVSVPMHPIVRCAKLIILSSTHKRFFITIGQPSYKLYHPYNP